LSPPLRCLEIHPTLACNLRCTMCGLRTLQPVDDIGEFLDGGSVLGEGPARRRLEDHRDSSVARFIQTERPGLGTLEDAVRTAAVLGCGLLIVSGGGEPLVEPDRTLRLIEVASECDLRSRLVSNGTCLDEAMAERLAAAGATAVTLSLLGPDADAHDRVADSPGAFDLLAAAARNVARVGLRLEFHVVWSAEVQERSSEVVRLVAQLGASSLWLLPLKGEATFPPSATARQLADQLDLEHNLRGSRHDQPSGTCARPHDTAVIHADGSVTPCCSMAWGSGDVLRSSLAEVWAGEWFERLRRAVDAGDGTFCRLCPDRSGGREHRSAPGGARAWPA
jgi:MoaA/NifB/PqqE/SkfB family radical SAM enzyme